MCTIQSNQTLDALIKYVAKYHILYSGQLEIRLSVLRLKHNKAIVQAVSNPRMLVLP